MSDSSSKSRGLSAISAARSLFDAVPACGEKKNTNHEECPIASDRERNRFVPILHAQFRKPYQN